MDNKLGSALGAEKSENKNQRNTYIFHAEHLERAAFTSLWLP